MSAEDTTDSDESDERQPIPWASHQPGARISGVPTALIYTGDLGSDVAQNDDSYAVLFEDVEVIVGDAFVNQEMPAGGTTAEVVGDDEPRPTDYRFVDKDDEVATFVNGALTTNEDGPAVYDPTDAIDDEVLVWYNGMSGNRVGRTLDFNGQPFARWTDAEDPYLVKGLYQAPTEWSDANSDRRAELARNDMAPRVARAPILRFRVEEDDDEDEATLLEDPTETRIVVDVSHYGDTRGYELHVFDEAAMADEFGDLTTLVDEMPRGQYGLDVDSELDFVWTRHADAILEQAQYAMHMHTGDGWGDQPEGWSLEYDLGDDTDFDVASEVVTDEDFEEQKQNFARQAAAALPDGKSPSDAFPGGLEGLVEKKAEQFYEDPTDEDVDEIRRVIYEQTEWLSTEDLA